MLVSKEGTPLTTDAIKPMEKQPVRHRRGWTARRAKTGRRGCLGAVAALSFVLLLAGLWLGPPAQATGGLPIVAQAPGRFSEVQLLEADPVLQEAYIAGVLDALMLAYAEGEALAAAGQDPRNAFFTIYEAVAHIPAALPLSALKEEVVAALRESAAERSAAFAVWRTLALSRCCLAQQAHLPD